MLPARSACRLYLLLLLSRGSLDTSMPIASQLHVCEAQAMHKEAHHAGCMRVPGLSALAELAEACWIVSGAGSGAGDGLDVVEYAADSNLMEQRLAEDRPLADLIFPHNSEAVELQHLDPTAAEANADDALEGSPADPASQPATRVATSHQADIPDSWEAGSNPAVVPDPVEAVTQHPEAAAWEGTTHLYPQHGAEHQRQRAPAQPGRIIREEVVHQALLPAQAGERRDRVSGLSWHPRHRTDSGPGTV